jgi:hypothetical protein
VADEAPTLRASITLATDSALDLSIISARTGVEADLVRIAGAERAMSSGHSLGPAPRSFWSHMTAPRQTYDLDLVLSELLDITESGEAEFRAVVAELDLEIWVSVHVHMECGSSPRGGVSLRSMERLLRLGADLDLDLYPGDLPQTDQRSTEPRDHT